MLRGPFELLELNVFPGSLLQMIPASASAKVHTKNPPIRSFIINTLDKACKNQQQELELLPCMDSKSGSSTPTSSNATTNDPDKDTDGLILCVIFLQAKNFQSQSTKIFNIF